MGGSVAFSIKKDGIIRTVEAGKGATGAVCGVDLFIDPHSLDLGYEDGHSEPFAPIDYGLTAIDFDAKWVGSIQDYCGLNKALFYGTNQPDFRRHAFSLFEAGRLRGFLNEDRQEILLDAAGFDHWFDSFLSHQEKNATNSTFLLVDPPSGWVFKQFENNKSGWDEMVCNLLDRDWHFDAAALSGWEGFAEQKSLPASIVAAARSAISHEKLDQATPRPTTVVKRRF